MTEKQDGKRDKNKKNLEVLELLNDERRREQRSNEEKAKTQNCFMCVKKLK